MTIQLPPLGFGQFHCADLADWASVPAEKEDPEAKEDTYYRCPSNAQLTSLLSLEKSKLRSEFYPFHNLSVSHTGLGSSSPLQGNGGLASCLHSQHCYFWLAYIKHLSQLLAWSKFSTIRSTIIIFNKWVTRLMVKILDSFWDSVSLRSPWCYQIHYVALLWPWTHNCHSCLSF